MNHHDRDTLHRVLLTGLLGFGLVLSGSGCSDDPGRSGGGTEGEGEGGTEGEGEAGGEGGPEGEGEASGEGGAEGEGEGQDPCLTDRAGPKVINAFSPDGRAVAVHFNEPVDPETAGVKANYAITGNDGSSIRVDGARVDQEWVHLTLDPQAVVNDAVTYTCRVNNVRDQCGNLLDMGAREGKLSRSLYLTIIWHQHQPNYYDPVADESMSPWVRKHATKDYYDMASVLEGYPNVHVGMNLTPVLLFQNQMYVDRLGPAMDWERNTIDVARWEEHARGRTDPWIDLLMTETANGSAALTADERLLYYKGGWCTVSTNPEIMKFFPEYEQLRDANRSNYSRDQLLGLKIYFELAWFDPDFLNGRVQFPHDPEVPDEYNYVDLSDLVNKDAQGRFTLKPGKLTEETARRLVAENYKVMRAFVPIHKKLRYSPTTHQGQIEILTTPYYHPILPLIFDSDLAREQMPEVTLPGRYHFPLGEAAGQVPGPRQDAYAQVAKAVRYYQDLFGEPPRGMWPGEGSVAQDVVWAFVDNGVRYIATGNEILHKSKGGDAKAFFPYRLNKKGGGDDNPDNELAILFRDTGLSDAIGFDFKGRNGEDAANVLLGHVLAQAPRFGAKDRLVVIILDGENAWEAYQQHDGKPFFHALYRKLQQSAQQGELISVTPAEYLDGNPRRAIPAHPTHQLEKIDRLAAGSWIGGNFDVWIGEGEENLCWDTLKQAREALQSSGIPFPDPRSGPPDELDDPLVQAAWLAWEEMYAAEGSDWFWWFGADQNTPGNDDTPFDLAFRAHIVAMFENLREAERLMGRDEDALTPAIDPPPCVQKPAMALRGAYLDPGLREEDRSAAPVLDGRLVPDLNEWISVGGLFNDDDEGSGAMAGDPNRITNDMIARVMYGYSPDALYVAIQAKVQDLSIQLNKNVQFSIFTSQKHIVNFDTGQTTEEPANIVAWDKPAAVAGQPAERKEVFARPGAARQIKVDFSGNTLQLTVLRADGNGGWSAVANHGVQVSPLIPGSNLLEFRMPYAALGITGPVFDAGSNKLQIRDPLQFLVAGSNQGPIVDVAPNGAPQLIFEDITLQVFVTFAVDVLGPQANLGAAGLRREDIHGQGGISIPRVLGSATNLGKWTLDQMVELVDDGTKGDARADDGIWSNTFPLTKGSVVNYKYLIRNNSMSSDSWAGEELPSASRGFKVCDDCKRMKLADSFNAGQGVNHSTGNETVITCEPAQCEAAVYCRPLACNAPE